MKVLYRVRLLVSGNAPPVDDGALLVQGADILAVGRFKDLVTEYEAARVVDFGDAIMAPLLVNAHTHLDLTDFPLWAEQLEDTSEPDDFVEWILRLVRIKRQFSAVDFHRSISNGLQQSLASGSGLVGDILTFHPGVRDYENIRGRGRVFLETLGHDPELTDQIFAQLKNLLNQDFSGDIVRGLSPHSPYTISRKYLEKVYQYCRSQQIFCSTHLAESAEETSFIHSGNGLFAEKFYPAIGWGANVPAGTGLRPVAYLDQAGGLFPQNLLVHGVQLNDEEIDVLASKRMAIALCPRSNSLLKVGKARAGKLLDSGVRLTLGTDSLASCASLSIWDEMAFAHSWFDGELDGPTLFYLATLSGAEVLGMAANYGSLEPGKKAAFQVLVPKSTVAKAEVFDYFVAPGCSRDIVHVYMDGKEVISDSQL